MEKELQIFIIWENGRKMEDHILQDIASKYEIIRTFSISWPEHQFARNLSRFYGKKIPPGCKKEKECGTGSFLVIVAFDPAPKYLPPDEKHPHGSNGKPQKDKYNYRQLLGGGYLVHASDDLCEAKENLLFLLGITPEEFLSQYPTQPTAEPLELKQKMIGADGWQSIEDLEKFLHKIGHHRLHRYGNDLVITTNNFAYSCRLLNLKKRFGLFRKNSFQIMIGGVSRNVMLKPES